MSGTAFAFPPSPATGTRVTNPTNNAVYLWDGDKWVAIPSGARVSFTPTAPSDAKLGDFWWDATGAQLYLYDGNWWIVVVNQPTGGGQAIIDAVAPADPKVGNLWWDPVDAKLYLFNGVEWIIAVNTAGPAGPRGTTGADGPIGPPGPPGPIPIAFSFPGQPPADTRLMVSIATPLVLGLGDSTAYSAAAATAATTFAINKISGGTTTPIGTVVFSGNNAVGTFTGMGGVLETGDVLEVVAPVPDATLADVAITILAYRIETGGVGGDGLTVAQAQAVQAMINTAITTAVAEALAGVSDGSEAAPGEVGEIVILPFNNVPIATRTPTTVATMVLQPGDWDINGGLYLNIPLTGTYIALMQAQVALTPGSGVYEGTLVPEEGITTLGLSWTDPFDLGLALGTTLQTGVRRLNVAVPTTIYLVAQVRGYGSTGWTCGGRIAARRMR